MSTKFIKLEKQNLSDQIIAQIKSMVETGAYKPGDKLPSERDLSQLLGVSRLPLREALKTLEFIGVLETKPKNGMTVKGLGRAKVLELLDESCFDSDILDDLKVARLALEIKAVELACTKRTESDLQGMADAIEAMAKEYDSKSQRKAIDASLAFHMAILKASRNKVLLALYLYINDFGLFREGRVRSFSIPGRLAAAIREHKEIYEAIKNRDANLAVEQMQFHLNTSY